jgi:hypothetical protein
MVPSKPILLELVVASVAIDHQMIVIHVQIGNFIFWKCIPKWWF